MIATPTLLQPFSQGVAALCGTLDLPAVLPTVLGRFLSLDLIAVVPTVLGRFDSFEYFVFAVLLKHLLYSSTIFLPHCYQNPAYYRPYL